MNKNIILFQFILCLFLFQRLHSMERHINPVTIERCPSVSKSEEFCNEVEISVNNAEKDSAKDVIIRFEAPLVPLLRKLDDNKQLKTIWQQRLSELFNRLASKNHRVCGLYCAYEGRDDLKFIAIMLEPLALSTKLRYCGLTHI